MRKAEISSTTLIAIIILVISLGVILLTYYQLIKPSDMDREACRASATLRGTLPDGIIKSQTKDIISLNCRTKKICVTTKIFGKGECEEVFGTAEGKYSTYRISKDKEKAEKQIKTLLAREMAECFEMLGRGAFSIFKREMTVSDGIGAVGVICSRIHFDKTVTNSENGLELKEINGLNRYLLTHKVPNHEMSYWDFLRNAYDGETMQILYGEQVKDEATNKKASTQTIDEFLDNKLDITKTKSIVYVEARPTAMGAFIGGGAGAIIGAVTTIFASVKTGGAALKFGPAIIGGATYLGSEAGDWVFLRRLRTRGLFPEGTYAAGIFLTDYTYEGFSKFNEGGSFEIASLP